MPDKTEKVEPTMGAKIFAAIIVFFIVVFIISALSGGDKNQTNSQETKSTANSQSNTSLASRVDKTLKEAFAFDSYTKFLQSDDYPTGSHIGYISKIEDVNKDTVRVIVQADLTESEAKDLGKTILSNVGIDLKELEWVVVRDTNGKDYNASRTDLPALR